VAFLEGPLFSANQGFLKTLQIVLIGWIKAGPPKKPLLFGHVNRLKVSEKFDLVRNWAVEGELMSLPVPIISSL